MGDLGQHRTAAPVAVQRSGSRSHELDGDRYPRRPAHGTRPAPGDRSDLGAFGGRLGRRNARGSGVSHPEDRRPRATGRPLRPAPAERARFRLAALAGHRRSRASQRARHLLRSGAAQGPRALLRGDRVLRTGAGPGGGHRATDRSLPRRGGGASARRRRRRSDRGAATGLPAQGRRPRLDVRARSVRRGPDRRRRGGRCARASRRRARPVGAGRDVRGRARHDVRHGGAEGVPRG